MTHESARFAHGPSVAQWLNDKGISPFSEHQRKRIKLWSEGHHADVYALDRILTPTCYGLWDLPEGVWLEARSVRQLRGAAV